MRRVLDILLTCNEHITNTISCSHISQCVTTDSVKLSLRPNGTASYKDPLVRCDQKPCPASQHSTLAQRAAPQTKTAWSRPAQRIGRVLWMSQWTQWGFRGLSYCFDVNGGNGRGGTYMLPRVRPRPPGHCDAAQLTIEEAWKGRPSNLSPTSQSPSGYNLTKNCCSCLSTLQGWCPHWWWVSQCLWFSAHSAVDWAQIYLPPGQPGFPRISREDDFEPSCSWNIHQLGVKHCWQIVHTNALQYMSGGQNHQRYETLKGRGSYKKGHFALAWKV